MTRKPGDLPCVMKPALGDEGQGVNDMTTRTIAGSASRTDLAPIVLALLIGIGLVFVAGFSRADALHDVAHDQRHAIAFPCH